MLRRLRPLVASLLLAAAPLALAQTYVGSGLTVLPSLDPTATSNFAAAINASGVVVGSTPSGLSRERPISFAGGVLTDLGTLGGDNGIARAISATGIIVGEADTDGSGPRAFSYSGGVMTNLGTLGGYESVAYGVNSSGVVVGKSESEDGDFRAFRVVGGVMTSLGNLGFSSEARAINSAGTIIGFVNLGGGVTQGFVYTEASGMTTLGVLNNESEFASSFALGLNDAGVIVGTSTANVNEDNHAFVYSGGVMTDLGTLGGGSYSRASAINNHGAIVGTYHDASSFDRAFYYANGQMIDLTSLFADSLSDGSTASGFIRLRDAYGINDSGQIVGTGLYFDFANSSFGERGFLLTVSAASAIPEPSTYAALAGAAALGLVMLRRRCCTA